MKNIPDFNIVHLILYTFLIIGMGLSTARLSAQEENAVVETEMADEMKTSDNSISESNTVPEIADEEINLEASYPALDNETFRKGWKKPDKFWQPHYHPQVTPQTFIKISYPYFQGGMDYPRSDISFTSTQIAHGLEQNAITIDPNLPQDDNGMNYDNLQGRFLLEKCLDMIYQWRSLNESPDTAAEIVRGLELTKTTTDIYRLNPDLAVQVKRTIGQIGKTNRDFDLTSRMALESVLAGEFNKKLFAQMDKQLAELTSFVEALYNLNDQIGIAIGLGALDRNTPYQEPINYSNLSLTTSY